MKLNLVTLAILLIFAVLFIRQAAGLPWTTEHIVGMSIAAPSFLLLIVARLQLGGAFSVQRQGFQPRNHRPLLTHSQSDLCLWSAASSQGIVIWIDRPWFLLILRHSHPDANPAQSKRSAGA